MTKRQWIIVVAAIFATLFVAYGLFLMFSGMKKKMPPPKHTPIIRKVESARVEYSDIETSVTETGRVLSQYSVDVIAEVQGKLLYGDIPFKKGASFVKGQRLLSIYSTDAEYSMKSRKSSFLNSLANILPDVKIDYPGSYDKWVSFFESVEISEALPALPPIESSQEKIFLSSRQILSTYYSIKADEVRLKKYSIYAPFTGAVQEVMLEVGSVANPGSRLAKIIKTGDLEIEVPLQIEAAKWVKKGCKAILRAEDGHRVGMGVVKREASFVDPNSQSINVYVEVLPGSATLYSGQYFRVEFPGMTIKNAMEIPRNATFNYNMVWVIEGGYLSKKEIEIIKTNEKTVIFSGLQPGTELVVEPLANARANMPVQTQFTNVHHPAVDTTKKEVAGSTIAIEE